MMPNYTAMVQLGDVYVMDKYIGRLKVGALASLFFHSTPPFVSLTLDELPNKCSFSWHLMLA